ncbi:hypothetical protein ACFQ07_03505, partial [Actinomadura adrarensis]
RKTRRAPDPPEEPEPAEPAPEVHWASEEEVVVDDPATEPEPEPGPEGQDVPASREDSERTENRGGAIYVLKDEKDRPG